MKGQMSLFDFINPVEFSWDKDINEIRDKIVKLTEKSHILISKEDFEIWSHVPQFGYRMSLTLRVTKECLTDEFFDEMDAIIAEASKRDVEISLTTPFFMSNSNDASMYVFSTFLDKKRRKVK